MCTCESFDSSMEKYNAPKAKSYWVMLELERLGVRVVSGRLGRKAGEEEESEKKTAEMMAHQQMPRSNSIGWNSNADLDTLMQRRSSSLGLSMMNDKDINPRGSMNSLGPLGMDASDPTIPPHRPLVGGGAAAAYEAARADHYAQKREEQQRRASSLGLGMSGSSIGGGAGMQMGLSVNPNQHYEMLKLHHMNLLNEIQETTLMMNLYQQQQLQQQQQQLQQQASAESEEHLAMLRQLSSGGGAMDSMYGSQRGSLGLGSDLQPVARPPPVPATAPAPAKKKAMSPVPAAPSPAPVSTKESTGTLEATSRGNAALQEELLKSQKEQEELEKKLKKLKDDIAKREREAKELQQQADAAAAAESAAAKRPAEEKKDGENPEPETKKVKTESKSEEKGESETT